MVIREHGVKYQIDVGGTADQKVTALEHRFNRLNEAFTRLQQNMRVGLDIRRGNSLDLQAERRAVADIAALRRREAQAIAQARRAQTSQTAETRKQVEAIREEERALGRVLTARRRLRATVVPPSEARQRALAELQVARALQNQVEPAKEVRSAATATLTALQGQLAALRQIVALEGTRARILKARSLVDLMAIDPGRVRGLVDRRIDQEERATEALARLNESRLVRAQNSLDRSAIEAQRNIERVGVALDSTHERANRLLFTFRRLFGVLAAFTAARLVFRGLIQGVRDAIRYRAEIEAAQFGIASLIIATNELRDATGQTADRATQLVLAQREAARQAKLLRAEALDTSASFESLLNTFQVGLAPGIEAGLRLDEIREFSVRIAQAAAAIGLAQNQLAEEIRSILSGTIQARTTRIAVALGITNEDIRRARETGTLFEFLQERFEAFEIAGEKALDTFTAKLQNTRAAILEFTSTVIGTEFRGQISIFENIKGLLDDIQNSLVSRAPDDTLEINPQAVRLLREFATLLNEIITSLRELGESTDFNELLSLFDGIGQSLRGVFDVLQRVVNNTIAGIVTINRVLRSALDFAREFALQGLNVDIFSTEFRDLLKTVASLVISFGVLSTLTFAIGTSIIRMVRFFNIFGGLVQIGVAAMARLGIVSASAAVAIRRALLPLLGLQITIGAFIRWLRDLEQEFGKELTFETVLLASARRLQLGLRVTFQAILRGLAEAFKGLFSVLTFGIQTIHKQLERLRAQFTGISEDELKKRLNEIENVWKGAVDALGKEIARLIPLNSEFFQSQVDQMNRDVRAIVERQPTLPEGQGFFSSVKNSIQEALLAAEEFLGVTPGFRNIDDPQVLADRFREIPAALEASTQGIAELTGILQNLDTELRRERKISIIEPGTDGEVLSNTRRILADIAEFEEQRRALTSQVGAAQERLNAEIAKEQRLVLERLKLNHESSTVLERMTSLALELRREETALADAVVKRERAEKSIVRLRAQGDEEQAEEARQRALNFDREATRARQRIEQIQAALGDRGAIPIGEFEELVKLSERIVQATEGRAAAENNLRRAQANETEAIQTQNELLEIRTREIHNRLLERLRLETQEIEKQSLLIREQQQIVRDSGQTEAARQFFEIQNQVAELVTRQQNRLVDFAREEAALKALVIEGFSQGSFDLIIKGHQQLLALKERQAELSKLESEEQEVILDRIKRIQEEVDSPVSFGISEGLRQFALEGIQLGRNLSESISSGLQGLSGELSGFIADIFDPSTNADLGERLSRLATFFGENLLKNAFDNLFALILQQLGFASASLLPGATALQAAATTLTAAASKLTFAALLLGGFGGLGGIGAPGEGAAGPVGVFAQGGPVGPRKGWIGHHRGVASFAEGGRARDPRDTIPAWLRAGEFVVRPEAVRKYGMAYLAALNRGMVPVDAIKRYRAGLSRLDMTPKRSFAEGGPVQSSRRPSGDRLVGAFLPNNEQTMERLLASGKIPLLRFLEAHNIRPQEKRSK